MKAISPWYGSSGQASANGDGRAAAAPQVLERSVGGRGRTALDTVGAEVVVEVAEAARNAELARQRVAGDKGSGGVTSLLHLGCEQRAIFRA